MAAYATAYAATYATPCDTATYATPCDTADGTAYGTANASADIGQHASDVVFYDNLLDPPSTFGSMGVISLPVWPPRLRTIVPCLQQYKSAIVLIFASHMCRFDHAYKI